MKIKIEDIKQIVEEVVQDAISEQEEQEAPEMDKRVQKVAQKLDKAAGLATSVKTIATVGQLEQVLTDVISRLDANKVTDQELKSALEKMYAKARKKELRKD